MVFKLHAATVHTVERWRNELDLDLVLGRVLRLGASQGGLDGVDALVSEAGDYGRQYKYLIHLRSSNVPSISDRTLVGCGVSLLPM